MKIKFACSNPDIKVGSYRIWIHDLIQSLEEIGVEAELLSPSIDNIDQENDILILSKGDYRLAEKVKHVYPDVFLGAINFDASEKNLPIDFAVVGSIEEADSLSSYETVYVPLIEKMFEGHFKKHEQKNTLKICYHGHYPHLYKFRYHLKEALEEFSKEQSIELVIITGNNFDIENDWTPGNGRPNIKKIHVKRWRHENIVQDILDCDIGIVPNLIDYSENVRSFVNDKIGIHKTDVCYRMKNKSNAGRCFVFHQLGIPVIADLTPSNFHVMGSPENGHLVMSKDGWLKALRDLRSLEKREKISQNAKQTFDCLYNRKKWAKYFVERILEIKNRKN